MISTETILNLRKLSTSADTAPTEKNFEVVCPILDGAVT
jgi:hypothetical protein